jgi:O-antigen/teichoic acid export membrane protein
MKKHIVNLITHPYIAATIVMVGGSNFVNAINYLYHVVMGRILGPSSYGELASLFSFIGLLSILPFSFGLVITKFISSAKGDSEIKGLLKWFTKRGVLVSLILFGIVAVLSPYFNSFLQLNNIWLIILCGGSFIFSIPAFLNRSVLLGLLRFREVVISQIIEALTKLGLGVLLVLLGFSVFGATTGLFISALVALFVAYWYLRHYYSHTGEKNPSDKKIFLYTLPVLLQTAANTSLYSSDLILVKHFFSSFDAGIYASVATLGKIVLYATLPMAAVMFSVVAKRKADNQNHINILLLSMAASIALCLGIILVYQFFPELMINTLFGAKYISGTNYLVPFAIFIGLLTLSTTLVNYFLSINKTKTVALPILAALIQIVGIYFFHENLSQVIYISIYTSLALLVSLSVYFVASIKNDKSV